jgi:parallel beta-helix repeat protein
MNKAILLVAAILFNITLLLFPHYSQASMQVVRIVNAGGSIQQAINDANENDIILISPSTYHEQIIIVNKTLTILGEDVETCIVDGYGTDSAVFVIRANGVKIMNLTIQNTTTQAGYGISADSFNNIVVSDCILHQCFDAVRLANCTNFTITRNIIKDNYYAGVYLHDQSSHNNIAGNVIQNNTIGLYLDPSTAQNIIYQNNFINNSQHYAGLGISANYWNGTYPSAGNFWDDYDGVDLYSGCDQSDEGSDGVGDTSRTIYGDVADFYPLMAPIQFFNAGTWNERKYYVAISTYFNVSFFLFYPNGTSPFISFNLSNAYTNSCRVAIPKEILWADYLENWTILINQSQPDFSKIMEDNEYTYFYFNFTSNIMMSVTIKIVGTYAIPELNPLALLATSVLLTTVILIKKKIIPTRNFKK